MDTKTFGMNSRACGTILKEAGYVFDYETWSWTKDASILFNGSGMTWAQSTYNAYAKYLALGEKQMKTITYLYEPMKEMLSRFERGSLHKEALINLLKDEIRNQWDLFSELASPYERKDRAYHMLDGAIKALAQMAQKDTRVWSINGTAFGTETKLTPFGLWLQAVWIYYVNNSAEDNESIITAAIEMATGEAL
jgi:hypothetical protein